MMVLLVLGDLGIGERIAQFAAGPVQARADGAVGDAEGLGDFLVAEVRQSHQQQRVSLALREFAESAADVRL
jgi:hypothetical protein